MFLCYHELVLMFVAKRVYRAINARIEKEMKEKNRRKGEKKKEGIERNEVEHLV